MKKLVLVLSLVALGTVAQAQTQRRQNDQKDHAQQAQEARVSPGIPGAPGHGPFPVRQCDDIDVISRVCGAGGILTPLLRDHTGVVGTFEDLTRDQKARVKYAKELGRITPEGWRRFETAFDVVVEEYKALANTLVPASRKNMLDHLARYQRLTREQTQEMLDSPMVQVMMDPATTVNAFYMPNTRSIYFFPAFFNEPRISLATFTMILAHEMGHHMDPEIAAKLPGQAGLQLPSRRELVGAAGYDCWNASFGSYRKTAEDWADWLASLVMDSLIQRFEHPLQRLRYTQNTMKVFCYNISGSKKSVGDTHAAPRDRILWVLRQPALRDAINCTGAPIEKKSPALSCNLQGRIAY